MLVDFLVTPDATLFKGTAVGEDGAPTEFALSLGSGRGYRSVPYAALAAAGSGTILVDPEHHTASILARDDPRAKSVVKKSGLKAARDASSLPDAIKRYSEFFKAKAAELYAAGAPGGMPQWRPAMEAVRAEMNAPYVHSTQWDGIDKAAFMPHVEQWLGTQAVQRLSPISHGYFGWTAAVFAAEFPGGGSHENVRIGTEVQDMEHFSLPWNPLAIQRRSQTILLHEQAGQIQKLSIERATSFPMLPQYTPRFFNDFVNDHILKGTPYEIKDHKDLSLLRDGTPVYADPDSLAFRTPSLAAKHGQDQWKHEWQQKVMAAMHKNCEALSLPEPLRWVVQDAAGHFATKQARLHPRSMTGGRPQPPQHVSIDGQQVLAAQQTPPLDDRRQQRQQQQQARASRATDLDRIYAAHLATIGAVNPPENLGRGQQGRPGRDARTTPGKFKL